MLVHGSIRDLKKETLKMIDFNSHYMLHEELKNYVINESKDFSEAELKCEYTKGHFIEQLKVLIRINKGIEICEKFYQNTPIRNYINRHGFESINTYMKLSEYINSIINIDYDDKKSRDNIDDLDINLRSINRKRKRDSEIPETTVNNELMKKLFIQFIKDNGRYIVPSFLIGSWSSSSSINSICESSYSLYVDEIDPNIREISITNIVNIDKLSDPKDYSIDLTNAIPIPIENQLTIDEVIAVSNIDIYTHSDYYEYKFKNNGKYPIDISSLEELKDVYSTDCPHQARWISEIARIRCSIIDGVDIANTVEEIKKQSTVIQSNLKDFNWLSSPFTAIFTYTLFPEINKNIKLCLFIKQLYYLYEFTNNTKPDCGLPSNIMIVSNNLAVGSIRKHFNNQREKCLINMINSGKWNSVEEIKISNEYEDSIYLINKSEQQYLEYNENIAKKCKEKMKGKPIYTTFADHSNHIFLYPGIWYDSKLYRFDKSFNEDDYKYLHKIQSYYNRINFSKKYHRKLDTMIYSLSDIHTDIVNTTSYVNFRLMFSSVNIFSITGNMKAHLKVSWSDIKLSDVVGRWWLPSTCMQETISEFALPTISEVVIIRDTEDKMDNNKKSYQFYSIIEYTKKVVSYDSLPLLRNVSRFKCRKPLTLERLNYYLLTSKISDITGINNSENTLYVMRMNRRELNPISVLDKRRFGYDERKKYKKENTFIYGSVKSNIDIFQGINYAEYLQIVSKL